MRPYSIVHICSIVDGQWLNAEVVDQAIDHLLLDSRQLIFPQTSLFFAIGGKRHNGHDYVANLYQRGVRSFVVAQHISIKNYPEAHFILVKDVLLALQQLAAHHRQQFELEVIGITGSNGKTIVKEWLFQLLQSHRSIVRSPKSYNSQIGVPLSVWQIQSHHQLGIFEAGISQPREMERIAPIIDCQIGIFTNIGAAHDEGFENTAEKIREKLQLFQQAKVLIYRSDDPILDAILQAEAKAPLFSWSSQKEATLRIQPPVVDQNGHTHLKGNFRGQAYQIQIPFSDQASIENAIHCWACLLCLGEHPDFIKQCMLLLDPVAMRLELKAGINSCQLINDSYNSDLNALHIALHFLEQQRHGQKATLILSDILQSGRPSEALYQQVAALLSEKNLDRLIGIGTAIPILQKYLPTSCQQSYYSTTEAFLAQLNPMSFHQEMILLKGARPFRFERIANRLSLKVHQTTLEINLTALQHNLSIYSQQLHSTTRLMVMVKASAYGSGSAEIARLLAFQQVDYLCVAYADEGASLRAAGIQLPIMVLNPEMATFETLYQQQLEPEIYSLALLRQLGQYLSRRSGDLSIHLKLETGMNRLGFAPEELPELIATLQHYSQLKVRSIFSHLAASESTDHDDFSEQQIQSYLRHYEQIAGALSYRPLRHVLNSAGIVRFPQYQMDMVRLGIGLYGIDPSGQLSDQLRPVHTLKARISQIKSVDASASIGYGRQGKLTKGSRIATISIGYADGLLRGAGNGRYTVLLHHQLAPTIGNICMDMCMIDVSHIPEASEGDELIVFGEGHPVNHLAECLNTIPYEVFTNISERVKRVYIQE
ncbi:MAG: bifunctional UDP-N-acetylmuramoyl-tripeptide:D-alanyl-D-alanine ligase/alanine racemase [Bacteroidota bacterium]